MLGSFGGGADIYFLVCKKKGSVDQEGQEERRQTSLNIYKVVILELEPPEKEIKKGCFRSTLKKKRLNCDPIDGVCTP